MTFCGLPLFLCHLGFSAMLFLCLTVGLSRVGLHKNHKTSEMQKRMIIKEKLVEDFSEENKGEWVIEAEEQWNIV